jgi:hypothetical protein
MNASVRGRTTTQAFFDPGDPVLDCVEAKGLKVEWIPLILLPSR